MRSLKHNAVRAAAAAITVGLLSSTPLWAEDAKPADDNSADAGKFANSLAPNAAEVDQKVLSSAVAVKVDDGKYMDKEGHPTFRIENDGKKVDWYTYSGYRRYHAECHVCHGPDAMGSTYAPALRDSLKRISYEEFYGILAGGKQEVSNTSNQVMPAFGDNKNVMCYADDLYVYLRARAAGAWGRARPGDKEAKPEAAKTVEKECLGG